MKSSMKSLILVFVLISSSIAQASPWIAGSFGFRFESESETGRSTTRNPYGLIAGHRWDNNEIYAEYSTFSYTTGNSTLEIKRTHQLGLAGYRLYPFDIKGFTWYPYFTAGVGGARELVTTRFLSQTDERESKVALVGTGGVGVWGLLTDHFRCGAEFRVLGSQEFNPAATLDLSLRAGFEF